MENSNQFCVKEGFPSSREETQLSASAFESEFANFLDFLAYEIYMTDPILVK